MLSVGLSGGIGSGKSTVARRLAALGAVVIDSDRLAREVVAPGSEGLAQVQARFGDGVVAEGGELDRAALASLVFADDAARRDLEAITHPLIRQRSERLVAQTRARAAADPGAPLVVVHDVPLLVEKRMQGLYDLVVIVMVDPVERLRRLLARGHSDEDARARMARQASDDERRAVADVILDNNGSPAELEARVDRLWHETLLPRALTLA